LKDKFGSVILTYVLSSAMSPSSSAITEKNKHMKCAKVRMNRSCYRWQFWDFLKIFYCYERWPLKMNIWYWNEGQCQIWDINYGHFKSKISIVTMLWPLNIIQRSKWVHLLVKKSWDTRHYSTFYANEPAHLLSVISCKWNPPIKEK
jgi:hypothetical protein